MPNHVSLHLWQEQNGFKHFFAAIGVETYTNGLDRVLDCTEGGARLHVSIVGAAILQQRIARHYHDREIQSQDLGQKEQLGEQVIAIAAALRKVR